MKEVHDKALMSLVLDWFETFVSGYHSEQHCDEGRD
jgi:hypothetical protein